LLRAWQSLQRRERPQNLQVVPETRLKSQQKLSKISINPTPWQLQEIEGRQRKLLLRDEILHLQVDIVHPAEEIEWAALVKVLD
jgi:hypothetical protein